jgi:hypothetical protein
MAVYFFEQNSENKKWFGKKNALPFFSRKKQGLLNQKAFFRKKLIR